MLTFSRCLRPGLRALVLGLAVAVLPAWAAEGLRAFELTFSPPVDGHSLRELGSIVESRRLYENPAHASR